jgi:hypothetical protein
MSLLRASFAIFVATFAFHASAQTFNFTVTPAGQTPSTMSASFTGTANFTGTFIGNYDAVANPGGTRTLTWNFLGTRPAPPTNLAKNMSGTGNSSGTANGNPVGTYTLSVDLGASAVTLSKLSSNLVGAATPNTSPVNATVSYDSFLTANPNYSYPFLFPVSLAIGNASLTSLQVTQTAPASGALVSADAGRYTFSLSVPADVAATLVLQGPPSTTTQSQVLTVTGSITPGSSSAAASLTISLNQSDNNTTPQPMPPNQPFDMPDPSGSTVPAHLLMSMTITSQSDSITGSATLPASGVLAPPPCGSSDFNGDGDYATDADIEAFFACLAGSCCPTCGSADFNGDGDYATDADIEAFFRVLAGGTC